MVSLARPWCCRQRSDVVRGAICYDPQMAINKYPPVRAVDECAWVSAIERAESFAGEMEWENDGGHLFQPNNDEEIIALANAAPPFALYAREDLAFEFARTIEAAICHWNDGIGAEAAYELRHALKVMGCLRHRYKELELGRVTLLSPEGHHSICNP